MARQRRQTLPVDTRAGLLASYDALDRVLTEGEVRGRDWIHARSVGTGFATIAPTDVEIFELHEVMFGPVFEWAGRPRTTDCGPGGVVNVNWPLVREELRKLAGDAACWVANIGNGNVATIARVVADFHHRFQWIHPFQDTNGRTGRVLDLLLLWRTFGLVGETLETSPVLEYFPDDDHVDEYYDALAEADNGRATRLRMFYQERITAIEAFAWT